MRLDIQSYLVTALSALAAFVLLPCPAQADQIVALVDEQGHTVYVNTGEPATRVDWAARSFRSLPATTTAPVEEIDRLVRQTAKRFQIDPQLVHAIIKVESEYDPNAVSRKGAMGLMQLVPDTARRFGVENPFDPQQNIEGGVNYLKYLLDLFGGDLTLSLAAYNAGEHTVTRHGSIPAFRETRDYVRKVTSLYGNGEAAPPLGKFTSKEPAKAPIIRYVDANGVVHFTNVE
jgi:soluble lytic murein transglycosylase-like protein